jgi:uncharacterized protein
MTSQDSVTEYRPGRRFFGCIPFGEELLTFLESFCNERSIQTAVFSLSGQVSIFTWGTLDQRQKVFVTESQSSPADIISGTGNITVKDGKPFAQATAVLCDDQGRVFGGRLFSSTVSFSIEFNLLELTGAAAIRRYDEMTGLFVI